MAVLDELLITHQVLPVLFILVLAESEAVATVVATITRSQGSYNWLQRNDRYSHR